MDLVAALDHLLVSTEQTLCRGRSPNVAALFAGTADRRLYEYFLTQTYHYVRRTNPLLSAAGDELARRVADGRAGPLHARLGVRFQAHASEEEGHERWVLDDLAAIGSPEAIVEAIHPCRAVMAYLAYAAFAVRSAYPASFLGAAFILEGLSAALAGTTARNLVAHSGIPGIENGVSFLARHADADQGHMEEARAVLAAIEEEAEKEAVFACAAMSSQFYPHILQEFPAAARA